jgi:hypothetical protein
MTLKELMVESHRIALAKGWWEKLPSGELKQRDPAEITCLYHSEVSEALEAYRDPNHKLDEIWFKEGKPEGFFIEMADLLIRIADTLEARRFNMPDSLGSFPVSDFYCATEPNNNSIPVHLNELHKCITHAGEAWEEEHVGRERERLIRIFGVVGFLTSLVYEGRYKNTFLDSCISSKMAYNAGREYRHGGKRC